MNAKKLVLIACLVLLVLVGTASALTELRMPSGTITNTDPTQFPISVGGLVNVTSFDIQFTFDQKIIVIQDIAVNGSISGLRIVNETYACNKGGNVLVTVAANQLYQTEVIPVLNITVRSADHTGTSGLNVTITHVRQGGIQYGPMNPPPSFDTIINGSITTTTAGQPAAVTGIILLPQGTVAPGSSVTAPLYLGNFGNNNFSVVFFPPMGPPQVTISGIVLNASNPMTSGASLMTNGLGTPAAIAWVEKPSGILQVATEGFLDVTFFASPSATPGAIIYNATGATAYVYMPSNGFPVEYPFATATDGVITVQSGQPQQPPAGGSQLWFPSGYLGPNEQKRFPIMVSNISNASSFFIMFHNIEPDKYVIDGVIANSSFPSITVENAFIVNTGGFADINLINPTGITVTTPTPLVDIIFHATRDPGWSFPMGMPFHITHNGTPFDNVYNGSIYSSGGGDPAVAGRIIAPSATLAPEHEATYQILVGNLSNADNLSVTLWHSTPAFTITGVSLNASVSGTMIPYYQPSWDNWAIYVNFASPVTYTTPVPVLDVTIRTNTTANTTLGEQSYLLFQSMEGTGEKPSWGRYPGYTVVYPFTEVQNGTITIGSPGPIILAPVGSVTELQRVTLPVSIANLSGARGIGFNLTYDTTRLKVHNVTASASFPDNWVEYDWFNTSGVLRVSVINMATDISAGVTPVPLVDITFEALNKTGSSGLAFIPHTEWSESPLINETNPHPFGLKVPGQINVTATPKPDLTPVLLSSPEFIKKNADGSLNITASFRVDNLGSGGAQAFKIEAEFAGSTANFTQGPPTGIVIPAGGNLVYNWVVRVIPGYGDTTLGENRNGNIINKTVTAGGDVAIGLKTINMTVDAYNDIQEINETNNRVSVLTTVARPNLTASLFYTLLSGIPDSNTSIQDTVIPGTYRISYSVTNTGNVFAVPTNLNFSANGLNTTLPTLPELGPGQFWNGTPFEVTINQYSGRYDYAIYANYDRLEKEGNDQPADYADNTRTISLSPFNAVALVLPTVTGSTTQDTHASIRLTGVSSSSPVGSVTIPFVYDPTVVYINSYTTMSGVTLLSQSYGRATFSGTGLNIASDTEIANISLRARDDSGRSAPLTSLRSASVKNTDSRFLELNITSGSFRQQNLTDAGVNIFTSPRGQVDVNKTISVTVFNLKATPVTVNANVTVTNTTGTRQIWEQNGIALMPSENRDFSITTWTPSVNDEYRVNATITGDDKTDNNRDSRQVFIDAYTLDITTQNKQWWNYNVTVFPGSWIYAGTYYTANQAGNVQGTVNMWYNNGTPVDLSDGNVFEFWYYTPQSKVTYGYDSNWNYVTWWILPKKIGSYQYSISLDAKGKNTYVNGTFTIAEPYVDIKVINSTVKDAGAAGITLPFEVFNETAAINKQVTIKAAAGAEGRTLQGLDYLTYYPYGCPEQTMSPTLATLRILQYYEKRGTLTPEMRADLNSKILTGVLRMSAPGGDNGQQQLQYIGTYGDGSGGWAWGRWGSPSMFYTMYPNYVLNEVLNSNTSQWNPYIQPNAINFSESATWLMNRQRSTGEWVEYGYIYDPYIWTGYTTLSLDHEYDNLNAATKERVNQSMQKSVTYLVNIPDTGVSNDARAFTIMGLVGIKNRIGNATLNATIDGSVANITAKLLETQHDTGLTTYWDGGGYWYVNNQYTTAQVLKALNATGAPFTGDNTTILKGVRYLVGIYNTGGRWTNTATTAGVMEAILQLQPNAIIDGSADITVFDAVGGTVKQINGVLFNNTVEGVSHTWDLNNAELQTLFNGGTGNASVVVTNWVKQAGADDVQLLVSVDNRMKLPISIANAKIPRRFIDPIADNFTLSVTVPAGMKQGDTGNVSFTVNNNFPTSADQYVMVVEIPVNTQGVTFEGSSLGNNMSYYIGTDLQMHYINHHFNATTNKLTIFPGSDNETAPSVLNQTSREFRVPLKFSNAGNISVQARAYPMYNDELMAVGNGTAYLKGFGNITLTASDQSGKAVIADFFVDGSSVATGTNTTTVTNLVERTGASTYAIAIRNGTSWVNASIGVNSGDTTTYAAQFVTDTTIPHITTIVGATDEVTIMSPAIQDTVSNSSTNHYSAVVNATKSFNSSIASSGGIATIEIDLPTIARAIGTIYVNDTISIAVHNASGWYSYTDRTVLGSTLRINNINTGDVDQIMIGFNGRKLGDVSGNGAVTIGDARDVAWYTVGQRTFSGNQQFYADVSNNGAVTIGDARDIAWYTVGARDANYQST